MSDDTAAKHFLQSPLKTVVNLLLLGSISMLIGCGETGPQPQNKVDTFPIIGKVTVNGAVPEKPKLLAVQATPVDSSIGFTPNGFASQEDGSFTLGTYKRGDGAPAGTYKLTFRLGMRNMMTARFSGDEFEGKYDVPETSEHTVTVTGNETEPVDAGTIDLEL